MTQLQQIEKYLESGKSLTPLEALDRFQCFRLAARVGELRNRGMKIKTIMRDNNGKRYAEYSL